MDNAAVSVKVSPTSSATSAAATGIAWVAHHQPICVKEVIGNAKTKQCLQLWLNDGAAKPCLITGPVGVGKTSLAVAFFRDNKYVVRECSKLPGDMLRMVEALMYRQPTLNIPRVGIIIDDMHTLDAALRKNLVALLKRAPANASPVICVVDQDVPPKYVQAIKSICHCVTMYRPLKTGQDTSNLLRALQRKEKFTFTPEEQRGVVEQSRDDLRALTILVEFTVKTKKRSFVGTSDVFTGLFPAAQRLMQPTRSTPPNLEEACKLMEMDGIMSLFVQENLAGLYATDDVDELSAACSLVSEACVLDDHHSHQLHHHSTALQAGLIVSKNLHDSAKQSSCRFGGASAGHKQKLQFPAFLGNCSSRTAQTHKCKEARLAFGGLGVGGGGGTGEFIEDTMPHIRKRLGGMKPQTNACKQWVAAAGLSTTQAKWLRDYGKRMSED